MRDKGVMNGVVKLNCFRCALLIGLMLTTTGAIRAQDPIPPQQKPSPEVQPLSDGEKTIALFDTITLSVSNLEPWLTETANDQNKITLYINGIPIKGVAVGPVENSTKLKFYLERTDENKESWDKLFTMKQGNPYVLRNVPVTIGYDNGRQEKSLAFADLTIMDKTRFWVFVLAFLALIALFCWLAYKSDIIRDAGPQPKGKDKNNKPNRKPFSLARTQMALWFFVVIITYVFIWIVTTDPPTLPAEVLGLIGISAVTGLSAAVVDSNKRTELESELLSLEEKKKNDDVQVEKLKKEITALNASINATPPPTNLDEQKTELASKEAELAAKQKEIEQSNQKIQELSNMSKPAVSKSFISDLLSDDNGISFHRFQMLIWTIVLIFVFVAFVIHTLAMKVFDPMVLALMGVVGGTYVGFKLPEQQG